MTVTFVLPFTSTVALRLGALDARLEMDGKKLQIQDLIIGCTAVEVGYTLATKNLDHFNRIPGLRIVTLI
jgi:tRNA(fMet)-specific endonuclease VapC